MNRPLASRNPKSNPFLSPAMAVSVTPCLPSKMNSSQPSLSCARRDFVGLRAPPPNCFGGGMSNPNVDFYSKVRKSIQSGCSNSKPTRGRFTMMAMGIPRVPYKNRKEGIWQYVDLWNALYRERVVCITQFIDEEFANKILATMLYLDFVEDSKRLYLYIFGVGGDLFPSLAIYDTMKSLKSPIATHSCSYTFNMAGFILAAGQKGYRSMLPSATVALQAPAGSAYGQFDDVWNEATEILRVRDYVFDELARNTGQPIEKIHEDLKLVKYLSSEEALEYGVIDRIFRRKGGKDGVTI